MITYSEEALEYISKLSEGGLRDAITLMDKCLSFSHDLTLENVTKALGTSDTSMMQRLTDAILEERPEDVIDTIERVHFDGLDLKLFVRQYINFILDIKKWFILHDFKFISIPKIGDNEEWLESIDSRDDAWDKISHLLDTLIRLNTDIRYDSSPKCMIEALLLGEI